MTCRSLGYSRTRSIRLGTCDPARILLRLRPDGLDKSRAGAHALEVGFPLAWSVSEGSGRVFYTSLGHFPAAYENIAHLHHLYGSLSWLLGQEEKPTEPARLELPSGHGVVIIAGCAG
jgi:type 1 glutamine amidotransferase